ncbi:MAG TPA: hypothetical protein VGT04_09085 [Acidobacteriaceae bacterium]|nr:hypothetical protein [Acidobacteriaceae bacterium]
MRITVAGRRVGAHRRVDWFVNPSKVGGLAGSVGSGEAVVRLR